MTKSGHGRLHCEVSAYDPKQTIRVSGNGKLETWCQFEGNDRVLKAHQIDDLIEQLAERWDGQRCPGH